MGARQVTVTEETTINGFTWARCGAVRVLIADAWALEPDMLSQALTEASTRSSEYAELAQHIQAKLDERASAA